MKYENNIEVNKFGNPSIKGTETDVYQILRMLSVGNSFDEVIKTHPEVSIQDIYACLEYATELAIVYDFVESSKKINEHFKKRHALAAKLRAMIGQPLPPEWYDLK